VLQEVLFGEWKADMKAKHTVRRIDVKPSIELASRENY
jgi:hypothetical protein